MAQLKVMVGIEYPINVKKEGKYFVATCKGIGKGIASQGLNKKEAVENLEEAIALYYEDKDSIKDKIQIEMVMAKRGIRNEFNTPVRVASY